MDEVIVGRITELQFVLDYRTLDDDAADAILRLNLPSNILDTSNIRIDSNVRGFESHLRQLIFLRKSDCLGCAVLLCLVCLTLLASFFLPSHLSLYTCTRVLLLHVLQLVGRQSELPNSHCTDVICNLQSIFSDYDGVSSYLLLLPPSSLPHSRI